MKATTRFKVGLVGLGGISKQHFKAISDSEEMELAAVVDLNEALVQEKAAQFGVPGFTDLVEMVSKAKPDVVVIAVDTAAHAALTLQAAQLGVRAIHCEKPMAVHPSDARRMVEACEESGALLTVNHQRRMGDLAPMIAAVADGLIGDLRELYGYCAGDFLSDGTHLLDSLLGLAGDPEVTQINAGIDLSRLDQRYGHIKESGAFAVLETKAKIRLSLFTGVFAARRAYQEYLIVGSKGMLWRSGDNTKPFNWFVCDGFGGDLRLTTNADIWFNMPLAGEGEGGPWRGWTPPEEPNPGKAVYDGIAKALRDGTGHPLNGRRTLQVQNLIGGIYLSGLRRRGVTYEEAEAIETFPLMDEALMNENGVTTL